MTFVVHSIGIVPQEVEQYRTFLAALYESVKVTKDQWPPVQFKEYIKLATVVKEEDFLKEDDCTKAMMNGNLEIIKGIKKPIQLEKVSHSLCIHNSITHLLSRLVGLRMVHWLAASLWKGFLVLASPP